MAGSTTQGQRAAATNKMKYGEDFYAKIGREGGKKRVPKGFALNRELASRVGTIGGQKSRPRSK